MQENPVFSSITTTTFSSVCHTTDRQHRIGRDRRIDALRDHRSALERSQCDRITGRSVKSKYRRHRRRSHVLQGLVEAIRRCKNTSTSNHHPCITISHVRFSSIFKPFNFTYHLAAKRRQRRWLCFFSASFSGITSHAVLIERKLFTCAVKSGSDRHVTAALPSTCIFRYLPPPPPPYQVFLGTILQNLYKGNHVIITLYFVKQSNSKVGRRCGTFCLAISSHTHTHRLILSLTMFHAVRVNASSRY